jgi:ABC-type multidrug transport system ATPase subunit
VVGGLILPDQAAALRKHIGFVAHQTFLYDDLTVRENLRFYGKLYGVPDLNARIERVIDDLGIGHRGDDRVRSLSRGLQQRAALARAILHDPAILLLDEPDTGLDVAGSDILRQVMVSGNGESRTVLLTSHNIGRALELVDRVVVIVGGKIAVDRPTDELSTAAVELLIRQEQGPP